jgi:hypothetical protein
LEELDTEVEKYYQELLLSKQEQMKVGLSLT